MSFPLKLQLGALWVRSRCSSNAKCSNKDIPHHHNIVSSISYLNLGVIENEMCNKSKHCKKGRSTRVRLVRNSARTSDNSTKKSTVLVGWCIKRRASHLSAETDHALILLSRLPELGSRCSLSTCKFGFERGFDGTDRVPGSKTRSGRLSSGQRAASEPDKTQTAELCLQVRSLHNV